MGSADPNRPTEAAASGYDDQDTIAPGGHGSDSVSEPSGSSSNVPTMFGRYQIERLLGQGGMGSVYLAQDTQLHRPVALKIPKFEDEPRPELVERFYREARSAALLRHPNLCPVYDVGEIDGTHYITMAYIEGRPLSDFLKTGEPKSIGQIATLVRKIALAVEEAHEHGIVHRDLKPLNIMIDKRHEPIIMDFGLAHQLKREKDPRLTQSGVLIGSPAYMSPEQLYGKRDQIGPASDVYALGVIFFELLTGRLPFEGPVSAIIAQVISRDPPSPRTVRADVDPEADGICLKMMAREIQDRYATMSHVAAALTVFLDRREARKSSAATVDASISRSTPSRAPLPKTPTPVPPPLPRRTTPQQGSARREPLPRPRPSASPQSARPTPGRTVQGPARRSSQLSRRPRMTRASGLHAANAPTGTGNDALLTLRLILAVVLPPAAVIACGQWKELWLNTLLTICGWIPGVVHAILIVLTPHGNRRPKS